MSETETEQEVTPDTPEVPETPQETPTEVEPKEEDDLPDWVKAKLQKVNNEAKNLRQRLKDQEPLVAAAQEAERAQMSELERERAEKADLAAQLAARDTEVLKARFNLTDDDLEFIGDGTFNERVERAEKYTARMKSAAPADGRPPTERPVSSMKPGASPSTPPVEDHSYPANWGFQPQRQT